MNSYVAIALTLRPRSWILPGASIAAFLGIILLTREFEDRSAHDTQWVIAATALLFGVFGAGFGKRIGRLREWRAATLVPGLLTKHARFFGAALLVAWGAWLSTSAMVFAYHQPDRMIPLASAALGLWAGATSRRPLNVLIALLICGVMFASSHVLANHIVSALTPIAVAGMAWALLSRTIHRPLTPSSIDGTATAGLLLGQLRFAQWCRDLAFDRFRERSIPQSVRLELALGLSPLMDWVSAFCLSLIVPLAMALVFLMDRSSPERLVLVAGVVNTILVVALAPLSLRIYIPQFDRVWLIGSQSRIHLAREIITVTIGQSIRLAVCSIALITALGCRLAVEALPKVVLLLTLSPASAALLISAGAWAHNWRYRGPSTAIALIASGIVLACLEFGLLRFASHLPPLATTVLMLTISSGLALSGIRIGASALAR